MTVVKIVNRIPFKIFINEADFAHGKRINIIFINKYKSPITTASFIALRINTRSETKVESLIISLSLNTID